MVWLRKIVSRDFCQIGAIWGHIWRLSRQRLNKMRRKRPGTQGFRGAPSLAAGSQGFEWWWVQSRANLSPAEIEAISLLNRENTGNFRVFGLDL